MSGKMRFLPLAFVGVLVVLAGIILVLNANAQKGKGWPALNAKAKFISGNTTILGNPWTTEDDLVVPNKILNDVEGAYYENVGNNTISIGYPHWIVSIHTDRESSRFVNLYFDDIVSPPGQNFPSYCAKPYFIYPSITPVTTTHLYMKGSGEFELIPDPLNPTTIPPTLQAKENSTLNFDNMTEGQETITSATWFYFHVPNLTSTKGTDESRVMYSFADCRWVKVTAYDFDGVKANRWIFKPLTEWFKHGTPGNWDTHFQGTVPHMLYSTSSTGCDYGTYLMPWELEIVRIQ